MISEKPILFSGAMVRAILDGRKTQTRRVVKPVRGFTHYDLCRPDMAADDFAVWWHGPETERVGVWQPCPYGKSGNRLWVRETWSQPAAADPGPTVYRADYPACVPPQYENVPPVEAIRWKPSIHMPRALSRITLEVTGVRVERLQDCSEDDAESEGVNFLREVPDADETLTARQLYACLWDSINGNGAWDANPWVWVVSFERVQT